MEKNIRIHSTQKKKKKNIRKYARLENANSTLISPLEVLIKLGIRPCNQNFKMAEDFEVYPIKP